MGVSGWVWVVGFGWLIVGVGEWVLAGVSGRLWVWLCGWVGVFRVFVGIISAVQPPTHPCENSDVRTMNKIIIRKFEGRLIENLEFENSRNFVESNRIFDFYITA
jgi:hypothetical protein